MELLKVIFLSDGLTLPSGEDFVNKVFPNIWAFLVQLIAFIIMCIVVARFAYRPVKNFLAKRKEYVAKNLLEAEQKNVEATKNQQEALTQVQQSKKEAIEIINQAKKQAEIERETILENTKKEVSLKKLQAQEDIKREQEKAIKEVHDEVVELAYEATKNILNREVSNKDNDKLLNDFVDDLIEKR